MNVEKFIIDNQHFTIGYKFNFLILYFKLSDYIQEKIIDTGILKKALGVLDVVLPIIGVLIVASGIIKFVFLRL